MSSEYILRPRGLARAFRSFALVFVSLAAQAALLQGQQPDGLRGTLDFGIVNAAGNTEVTTVNVGEELLFSAGPWGVKQTFGVVYGRTDGEVSASLWRGAVRGDRSVGERLGVYLLVAFDRNTFAGLSRRFEEGIGLVLSVLDTSPYRLEFEGGAGLTQQRSTEGEADSFVSARAASTFRRDLGDASHMQFNVEVLPNLENSEDLRVNSLAELVAPISQQIATKITYAIRFDRDPQEGFERSDRILTAGLQITF